MNRMLLSSACSGKRYSVIAVSTSSKLIQTIFSITSLKLTLAGADMAFCIEDCVLHDQINYNSAE